MKKLFLLALLFFTTALSWGQCPPSGNLWFYTQAEADQFAIDYPNCTTLNGVVIFGGSVHDLSPFSNVTSINGQLHIYSSSLLNLNGLNNLTTITGNFEISAPFLTDLSGLNALTTVDNFHIWFCSSLTSLSGLGSLQTVSSLNIQWNILLTTLNSLNALTTADYLSIRGNSVLTSLAAFSSLTTINHSLKISSNPLLSSISDFGALVNFGDWSNIPYQGFQLYGNTQLAPFSIQPICDFLSIPNNSNQVYNNAQGSNSISEIIVSCVPTTHLTAQHCSIQLNTFNQSYTAISVANATSYEFEYVEVDPSTNLPVNGGTNATHIVNWHTTSLHAAGLYEIGKKYQVRIRGQVNGTWGVFGNICYLYTPTSLPTTQLANVSCGAELTNFGSNFYCNSVAGFSQYEFEFTEVEHISNQPILGGISGTHIRNWHSNKLTLTGIPGMANTYNKKYAVRVRVQMGSLWGAYGPTCYLYSPIDVPATEIQAIHCNTVINGFGQPIFCNAVTNAVEYEFQFTDLSSSAVTTVITTSNNTSLNNAGLLTLGAGYDVAVRARIGSVWGTYGPSCNIGAPNINPPTTQLQSAYCLFSTTTFDEQFFANQMSNATLYEFEFTNQNTNAITTATNTVEAMNLNTAGLCELGITYSVRVRTLINGVWSLYGPICEVLSPNSVPTTELQSQHCGVQVSSSSQTLFCNLVACATDYDFEFYDAAGNLQGSSSSGNASGTTSFAAAGITSSPIGYWVIVRAVINGTAGAFGAPCHMGGPTMITVNHDITDPHGESNGNSGTILSISNGFREDIKVYPNPSNDFVIVSADINNFTVIIQDMKGQIIQRFDNNNGSNRINLTEISDGLYLVTILDQEGQKLKTSKLTVLK